MKFSKHCLTFICLNMLDREAQLLTVHTVPIAVKFHFQNYMFEFNFLHCLFCCAG